MHFRHLALSAAGAPLPAIRDGREAEAAWALARDLLAQLKAAGQRLHLCIAGGPRLLALTLTSAAMLHCEHQDRLWHLYTPPEFLAQAREGAILHAPPEVEVRLVPVPFMPWGAYFPALRQLTQSAPAAPQATVDAACCAQVWAGLTPAQQAALTALSAGRTPHEAAVFLNISLKTLDTHKTQILAACRQAWGLPEAAWLTYRFLHEKFGPWVQGQGKL